jgi:hypothetical protein
MTRKPTKNDELATSDGVRDRFPPAQVYRGLVDADSEVPPQAGWNLMRGNIFPPPGRPWSTMGWEFMIPFTSLTSVQFSRPTEHYIPSRSRAAASQGQGIDLSSLSPNMQMSTVAQCKPAMVVPVTVSSNPCVQAHHLTYINPAPVPTPINPVFTSTAARRGGLHGMCHVSLYTLWRIFPFLRHFILEVLILHVPVPPNSRC